MAKPLRTMAAIRRANAGAGHHWFEPATLRFFRSAVYERTFPADLQRGTYFVSSEQYGDKFPRLFSVRFADWDNGHIRTVGEFQGYPDRESAFAAAAEFAALQVRPDNLSGG